MKRSLELLAVLAVALLPTAALAGTSSDASLVRIPLNGGLAASWAGTTRGIAMSFLPFLLLVSIAAEAWGKGPTEQRDFGAVLQRFAVIFLLLTFYGQIFGAVAELLNGAANSIAPSETWTKLQAATKEFLSAKAEYQAREMDGAAASGSAANVGMQWITGQVDALGGQLIDSVVTLIVLCGQASFRIVGTLGAVLSGLLYVLGPLAIAGSMPRSSDSGGKWFRVFVSVLAWPLISSVMVGLLTGYALQALQPTSSYEAAYSSIVLAGILAVTAFAVPVVASALTGAGMGAVGAGWSSLNAWSGAAATAGAAVAGGAHAAGALSGAPAAAASGSVATGGGASGGGGGGGGGLQSSAATSSPAAPQWASAGARAFDVPAPARVSPAADRAANGAVAAGGGVDFPPREPAQPKPPPFLWSQGGVSPAADAQPGDGAAALPGPAAAAEPPTQPYRAPSPARVDSAPPPVKPVASLPKGSEQAFRNWARLNPGADPNEPRHRAAILAEHARLAGRSDGQQPVQRGGDAGAQVAPPKPNSPKR